MTYRDQAFNGVLDIQLAIEVAKAEIRSYKAKQKFLRLKHASLQDKSEVDVAINLYENYLNTLEQVNEDIITYMEIMAEELKDDELELFILKYGKGMQPKAIMEKMYISKSKYYDLSSRLEEKLEETESGEQFLTLLRE